MGVEHNVAQMLALAAKLGMPERFPGGLVIDEATIRREGPDPFLFAISEFGTQLYWFHRRPNPWDSLSRFLECTGANLPGVRYWIIGGRPEPVEVVNSRDGESAPRERDVLAHFRPTPRGQTQ